MGILDFIKNFFAPREVYLKIDTPEKYKKYVNQALSYELGEAIKKANEKDKTIESQNKLIQQLQGIKDKEMEENLKEQNIIFEKIRKEKFFDWFCKPIKIVSAWGGEMFRDGYGNSRPYLVGFRLIHTPYSPIIKPLLSRKPNAKDIAVLETHPPIPWENLPYLFADLKKLIYSFKSGISEIYITPQGDFMPPTLPFRYRDEESTPKKVRPSKKK